MKELDNLWNELDQKLERLRLELIVLRVSHYDDKVEIDELPQHINLSPIQQAIDRLLAVKRC